MKDNLHGQNLKLNERSWNNFWKNIPSDLDCNPVMEQTDRHYQTTSVCQVNSQRPEIR